MTARLALLCPGQGGQHSRMFEFVRRLPQLPAAPDLDVLPARIGMPLDAALTDPQAMFANRVAQPLIVAATAAVWEALRTVLPEPALVAGYSVGELSAYAVAGALDADEAIALAARRADIMDASAGASGSQGLLAVSGERVAVVKDLLAGKPAFVAIETGEDAVILGGETAALAALQAELESAGAHATPLPVGVASHTPLLRAAVAPFADALRRSRFADPRMPVLAGITAEPVARAGAAIDTLSRQLAQTIRWKDCMDALAEAGITIALELGPGAALSRMLRNRHPRIESRSICDFRSVRGVADWVARHAD